MSACATSSPDDTRWQDAALTDSLVKSSMENLVCCVSNAWPNCPAVCLAVKPVGEPDAGDRHVRFDERGWETERCRKAQATAPILDSTKAAFYCDAPIRSLLEGGFNRSTQHLLILLDWEVSDGGECADVVHAETAGRALGAMEERSMCGGHRPSA